MINEILQDTKKRMQKSIETLESNLGKIRTGRASTGLLEQIKVDYYGSMVPLTQAANVSVSDYRSLQIQVWEKSMVGPIEKAIINSDLGLTPNTAGQTIHINLPPLTEDRRKELAKFVRAEGEQAKIAIRNIRRDANQSIAKLLEDKEISEDEQRDAETDIQKSTDSSVTTVDSVISDKEKELMEI